MSSPAMARSVVLPIATLGGSALFEAAGKVIEKGKKLAGHLLEAGEPATAQNVWRAIQRARE
jgi:hypothetical protein